MNKQIEEMARVISEYHEAWKHGGGDWKRGLAEALYNADYRKQIVGEWITQKRPLSGDYAITCSCCGYREHRGPAWNPSWVVHKFCPNCGARMRKEDEGK